MVFPLSLATANLLLWCVSVFAIPYVSHLIAGLLAHPVCPPVRHKATSVRHQLLALPTTISPTGSFMIEID